jgi:predicted anti-sigma-YlaC factor YlaD
MHLLRFVTILILLLTAGCSARRFAVNQVGNALAGSGEVWASDDDPDLIRDAAPFSLKLVESLLAESPRHRGMLLIAASGFTQYSFAFIQPAAEQMESEDLARAAELRDRARRMYLRARGYGLRGLETRYRGFTAALDADPVAAVQRVRRKDDVPFLYWTAAAWGATISISKDQPELIAQQPQVEALIDRALVLDETFEHGAIHAFLVSYELARPGGGNDAVDRARRHFDRAMELSGGRHAGPLVAWAESVCVRQQDRQQFETLLNRALAIDPDDQPDTRLVNLVVQRRARWLLGQVDELFLE